MYTDIINQVKFKKGNWRKAKVCLNRLISSHRYSAMISKGYIRQYNNQMANMIEQEIKNV